MLRDFVNIRKINKEIAVIIFPFFFLICFFISNRVFAGNQSLHYKNSSVTHSVLSTGYWYKVKITQTGIYKLTYSELKDLGFSNLQDIRVYGNGGKQLSYMNSDPRPSDLQECSIYMNKGSDGIFNDGDYILFYAQGPVTWNYSGRIFRQKIHAYSDGAYYFLTTDHGKADDIITVDNTNLVENKIVTSYDDYGYFEHNYINVLHSGRRWFSEEIGSEPFDTTFSFEGMENLDSVRVIASILGRSENYRSAHLIIDGKTVQSITIAKLSGLGTETLFGAYGNFNYTFHPGNINSFDVKVSYDKQDDYERAYLDYVTVNVRRALKYYGPNQFFRDIHSVGPGNVARFDIQNVNSDIMVWDVTNINNVFAIKGTKSGSSYQFKSNTATLREFAIVDPSYNYPSPITDASVREVGKVENQDLHGLPVYNYIIVSNPLFLDQAKRLADFHRKKDNLSVLVVTPEQIYNEFSSGAPDVSALRDFFRYQYKKGSGSDILKYVLLFGDGSYNNHMYKDQNTNYILTYESKNSIDPIFTLVTDDFFGFLGDNEGGSQGKLAIGIGRLPVKSLDGTDSEAKAMVDKIESYYNSPMTDWRTHLCFLGDDGYDGGPNTNDTEFAVNSDTLTSMVGRLYPGFEFKKIYLDAYQQIIGATGPSYPDAHTDVFKTLEKGVLLFNFMGHGGENGLTAEKVIQTADMQALRNKKYLPLFITATCQFSRFDDVDMEDNNNKIVPRTTAGEVTLLNPDGGAIALYSTTRVVYQYNNMQLNTAIFRYLFKKDSLGNRYRLGDVIRLAKNSLTGIDQTNNMKFALLGDPALTLAYPEFNVATDSVNGVSVNSSSDTLKAFSRVTVSGHISDDNNQIMSGFNGIVYPSVYDKAVLITTRGNDNVTPIQYYDQSNILFKGKASVVNGRFKFSFVVPKDISYDIGKGKIGYYAEDSVVDAKGEYRGIYVGGTNDTAVPDDVGPGIKLYMNNEDFKDGGITNDSPSLLAELSDSNGINMTGIGIGHDIVAYLDNDQTNIYILNDYYEAAVDSYKEGTVVYPLNGLSEGEHTITLKAWDVFNNSSEASINFVVKPGDGLFLDKLINYPNPAVDYTYFQYTHNAAGEIHDITLDVYDLSGRLMVRITRKLMEDGFISTPLYWNLRTSSGGKLPAGIYPYRIKVTTSQGTSYLNQKLIILP